MEITIVLMLLLAPGYIASRVGAHVLNTREERDKFKIILESLIYDLLILPLVFLILYVLGFRIENVEIFFRSVRNISFYALIAFGAGVLSGFAWGYAKTRYESWVNKQRRKCNRTPLVLDKSLLDIEFDDGEDHWVEVHKNGEYLGRGILTGLHAENREIALKDEEHIIGKVLNEDGSAIKYRGIYIDYANDLIIKEIETHFDSDEATVSEEKVGCSGEAAGQA